MIDNSLPAPPSSRRVRQSADVYPSAGCSICQPIYFTSRIVRYFPKIIIKFVNLASSGSAVVEQVPHHPKVKGWSPTAAGIGRERERECRMVKKIDVLIIKWEQHVLSTNARKQLSLAATDFLSTLVLKK